jgi:hypothetical protein
VQGGAERLQDDGNQYEACDRKGNVAMEPADNSDRGSHSSTPEIDIAIPREIIELGRTDYLIGVHASINTQEGTG